MMMFIGGHVLSDDGLLGMKTTSTATIVPAKYVAVHRSAATHQPDRKIAISLFIMKHQYRCHSAKMPLDIRELL